MKDLKDKIKYIEDCAQELLDFGNSREKSEAYGLFRALRIIKGEDKINEEM